MESRRQRTKGQVRWLKPRLPAALLAVLLTAPFGSACSSDLACDGQQGCGLANGSGLSGASGSSSGGSGSGSLGTGPLAGAGGANVSTQGGAASANGGANTGGFATGGAITAGGTAQAGMGSSAGGAGSGNAAGAAAGGKASGGGAGSGAGGVSSGGGSVSSGGMGGVGGSGSLDPYASARQTCVDRVNTLRATKGLAPIPRLPSAEACADAQAKKDSESGVAHSAFGDCVNQVQGWTGAAQNECPGYGSVASTLSTCIDQMWAEGPGGGHYDNMVGGSNFIACGFYTTPSGKVWMLQDFWSK